MAKSTTYLILYSERTSKAKKEGREEGLEEGLVKGREEGLAKGLLEGQEKGAKENTLAIARTMKREKMPLEIITKLTGLDASIINSL